MVTAQLLTAADLAALPDDGDRLALLRGELIRMPPAKSRHGRVATTFNRRMDSHAEEHGLGAVYDNSGFLLGRDPTTILAPDAAFVRAERVPLMAAAEAADAYPELAPDLVVEIVSPSDRLTDVQDKVLTYLDAGVRLVWVADPRRRTIAVWDPRRAAHVLTGDEALDGGGVLPGFRVAVADLFP
jgi:Uma2 family endonuclease